MKHLKVKCKEDFIQQVRDGDLELARIVIRTVLQNLNSKPGRFNIAEIEFEDEGEIYELSCHSDEFILTLEKNLQLLIEAEAYEECIKVTSALRYLKSNNQSYDVQI